MLIMYIHILYIYIHIYIIYILHLYICIYTYKHTYIQSMHVCYVACPTLCDSMDYSLPGSSVHGILQANTGVSCYALFQGIFQTQGSNLHLFCLLHWQVGSLPLVPSGKTIQSLYMRITKIKKHT